MRRSDERRRGERGAALRIASTAACAALAALIAGCGGPPEGLERLADRFREANRAETAEPMLDLYHLEGATERTVTRLRRAARAELGMPIERIAFEELSGAPEETIRYEYEGRSFGPTLRPRYRMRVVYDTQDRFTSLFTVGQAPSGRWKFVCAAPLSPNNP